MPLTPQRLHQLIDYNPKTGVLRRRSSGRIARASHAQGYVQLMIDGEMYLGHRIAWFYTHGCWPDDCIDHVNADRADNRITNLREATRRLNVAYQKLRKNNTSGFKGI